MDQKHTTPEDPELTIDFNVNGEDASLRVAPWDSALVVLRDQLGLMGHKEGCGIGECGACTVIVDGYAVNACLTPAPQLHGRRVETIEGLGSKASLHPLQEAFLRRGAVQCGFCTPGAIMSAKALLDRNPRPDRDEIVNAISGNLCRCTGYRQIVDAVEDAAED